MKNLMNGNGNGKWKCYDNSFNSWIDENDIIK